MEIKIGIRQATRELTVDTEQSAAQIEEALRAALADEGLLVLTERKGRKVLIPADRVAYIDLGQENVRPVGFGAV